MKNASGMNMAIFIIVVIVLACLFFYNQYTIKNDVNMTQLRNVSTILSSSSVVNFISHNTHGKGVMVVTNCSDLGILIRDSSLYQIIAQPIQPHTVQKCTLTGPNQSSIEFYEIGVK